MGSTDTADVGRNDDAGGSDADAGSDAVLRDAAGDRPCTIPPTHALSAFSFPAMTFQPDGAAPTFTMPDGYLIQGTLTFPDPPAGTTPSSAALWLTVDGKAIPAVVTPPGPLNGSFAYSIVVPAGTFPLAVQFGLDDPNTITAAMGRSAMGSLTVCGDATHDLALPALPPLGHSKLTVTGLDALGATGNVNVFVALSSRDRSYSVSNTAVAPASSVDIDLLTPTGGGTYDPFCQLDFTLAGQQSDLSLILPALDGPGPWIAALPELVAFSGTVSNFQPTVSVSFASVGCDPPLDPSNPGSSLQGAFASFMASPHSFKGWIPKGWTCAPFLSTDVGGGPPADFGSLPWAEMAAPDPSGLTPTTFTADVTKDFILPTFDGRQTLGLRGIVQSTRGEPLTSYMLEVSSSALADPAWAGDRFTTESAWTKADGTFQLGLLRGTYDYVRVGRFP
jgi:hypothetical protein